MDRLAKNQKIKETGKATRERRKDMLCRVFEVKVDLSRMSKSQRNDVNTLFREAKWFRNAYLADNGLSDKSRSVKVKVKDIFEEREITLLGSQIKQSIISEVKDSIRGLAVLKKNGYKVGALRFKSVCNCVNLIQFHMTVLSVGKIKDVSVPIPSLERQKIIASDFIKGQQKLKVIREIMELTEKRNDVVFKELVKKDE